VNPGRRADGIDYPFAVGRLKRSVLSLEFFDRRRGHVLAAQDPTHRDVRGEHEAAVLALFHNDVLARSISGEGHVGCTLNGHAHSVAGRQRHPIRLSWRGSLVEASTTENVAADAVIATGQALVLRQISRSDR
jgi:hypothetical protein